MTEIEIAETEIVSSRHISCDGGELGHPKVYLDIGNTNRVVCPYCGKEFIYDAKLNKAEGK